MILVLIETDAGGATEVSRETVTFARGLAAAGGGIPIDAVVVGEVSGGVEALAEQLATYGVRDVHHAIGEAFDAYGGAAWASAVGSVRETTGSVVVTAAGTPRGMEVLAHLAARAGVAMAANVVGFEGLSPFTVHRQVVGGSVLEEMVLDERPAVFTVAGHAVEAAAADSPGAGTLVERRGRGGRGRPGGAGGLRRGTSAGPLRRSHLGPRRGRRRTRGRQRHRLRGGHSSSPTCSTAPSVRRGW